MLNAIAEAITLLKTRYRLEENASPRCVLVGHDWGGAIAFRLAAQTANLVDEAVVVNSTYVRSYPQALLYMTDVLQQPAAGREQFRQRLSAAWIAIRRGNLIDGVRSIIPVLSQFSKSYYVGHKHLSLRGFLEAADQSNYRSSCFPSRFLLRNGCHGSLHPSSDYLIR